MHESQIESFARGFIFFCISPPLSPKMASRQGGGQQYRVHTARAILSAFAGALLASTPRSDALLALPAALPPATAARGQGARQRGTGPAAPAAAAPAAFGMQRRPSSSSSSTSAPACAPASGSRSSIGRSRRHRASLLVMSGLGAGDEGAGGGGGAEGGEVVGDAAEREGAAVEGQGGVMMGRPPAGSASEEGEDEKQEGGVAAKRWVRERPSFIHGLATIMLPFFAALAQIRASLRFEQLRGVAMQDTPTCPC